MSMFRNRSGGSKITVLIILAVLVLVGYSAWQFIMTRIKVEEFDGAVFEVARQALIGDTQEKVVKELMMRIEKMDMPVTEQQIMVEKKDGRFRVRINYVIDVKFPLYTYHWNVTVDQSQPEF